MIWTLAALVFENAATEHLSGLLHEVLQCHSNPSILFSTRIFKWSWPFWLSLTSTCNVSDECEWRTLPPLTFWFGLWRTMLFCKSWQFHGQLVELVYSPRISEPALSHGSTSGPDKRTEENSLEQWMSPPSPEERPTPSASQHSPARPCNAKMVK